MNETISPARQGSHNPSYLKISWAILIVASLYVCYFSHLGALGFVGPDEPRYAWIAREMAQTGDWITPRLYGRPWFEKPILYYWGAATSFKLFGESEAAARFPSAFSALLATLALAWLALRMGGWHLAGWLLLLLPTTVGMLGFAHAAAPDMAFAAILTCATVCAAGALELISPSPSERGSPLQNEFDARYLWLFLFGFCLGTAILAKGPAAIILSGGAILLFAAATKRWRDVLRLLHPIAIASLLLTSLPWYILCARRNPDFLHVFVVEHNFRRYLTPEFQHLQPFWYYLPIAIVALLPWVFWLAWFALREGRVYASQLERTRLLFLAGWAISPILFFSLSKSKLPGYILPAVPPLGLLIAWAVARSIRPTHKFTSVTLTLSGIFFLLVASGVYLSGTVTGKLVFLCALVAGLGGFAIISGALLRRARLTLIFAAVLFLILSTFGYVSAERLDSQFSARRSAATLTTAQAARIHAFRLQRAWHYQFNYYLHREIREWNADSPVEEEAIVITNERNLAELKKIAEIVSEISHLSPQAVIVAVRPLSSVHAAGGGQPR